MDVDVGRARYLIVDDVVHSGDVETTGGDVSREKDRVRRRLETAHGREVRLTTHNVTASRTDRDS